MTNAHKSDPAAWIKEIIREFIDHPPENTLQGRYQEKTFEILRFCCSKYKLHLTPQNVSFPIGTPSNIILGKGI